MGEHVDYAGGNVLCAAIDLGVAVAVRWSGDGVYRVVSDGRRAERRDPRPAGDIGDRVFAAAVALRQSGVDVPAAEVAIVATLPESSGLASSAAVTCATIVAALRLAESHLPVGQLIATALHAERDIAGVPCGPLDPTVIVSAPEGGVLLLDCATLAAEPLAWPWSDVTLAVCATGERHDVGGAEYGRRREESEAALRALGGVELAGLSSASLDQTNLPDVLRRRARHVISENVRSVQAAGAMRRGDAGMLGALMAASHRSLRDDHEVSTPLLDAVVAAATACAGCYGARLVGAGFGGSVIALVRAPDAAACSAAMLDAAGEGARVYEIHPGPGLQWSAPDAVGGA